MTKKTQKKYRRKYSHKTLKILFALSRNECVEPSCTNPVILPKTEYDEEAVSARISHIYALNDNGPRGKPGLTQEERNHHNNLLLLCPTHHVTIDEQHNTFPAPMLQKWKFDHEQRLPTSLLDKLAKQFGNDKPEASEEEIMMFLGSKAQEYREMRVRLAELTAIDGKLSEIMSYVTLALDKGDFANADKHLQTAEEFQYESETRVVIKRQADFRLERGNAALISGDLDTAIHHYEKAAGYFNGLSKDDEADIRHTYVQQLRYYAYRYRDSKSLYAAKDALTKNLNNWQQTSDFEKWCMTMNSFGGVLVRLSEFDAVSNRLEHLNEAKDCYKKVRDTCSEFPDSAAYATASLDLANVFSARDFSDTKNEYKSNLEFAIELQTTALDHFKETTQPRGWGIIQHNLGCSYTRLSELANTTTEAVNLLKQAIEHSELSFRVRSPKKELQYWVASCRTAGEAYINLSMLSPDDENKGYPTHAKRILNEAQSEISREEHPNQWGEIEKQLLRLSNKPE